MTQEKLLNKTFVVEFWSRIFDFLGKLTLFYIILYIFPQICSEEYEEKVGKYGFVEIWVFFFTILSFLCMFFSKYLKIFNLERVFICIGAWRLYEVIIYQINVVFFEQYRTQKKGKKYEVRGYLRIVLLLLHNFFEIIFWFAFFYQNLTKAFNREIISFIDSLNFSFYTMTTFGHTFIKPTNYISKIITFIQSLLGLFIALVVLSAFISYLPPPGTTEETEDTHTHVRENK